MQPKDEKKAGEIVFIIGQGGCGKSTLIKKLSWICQDAFIHLEASEILKETNDPEILDHIERRVLVPDELMFNLLKDQITETGFCKKENNFPQTRLMIVTGFPRTYQQVLHLDKLRRDLHPEVGIYVAEIRVGSALAKSRILARGRDQADLIPERVEKRISCEQEALRGVRAQLAKMIQKGVVINKLDFANDMDSIDPLVGEFEQFLGGIGALSYFTTDEEEDLSSVAT